MDHSSSVQHAEGRLGCFQFLAIATRLLKCSPAGFLCGHTFSDQVGNRKTHGDEEKFPAQQVPFKQTNKQKAWVSSSASYKWLVSWDSKPASESVLNPKNKYLLLNMLQRTAYGLFSQG